MNNNQIEFLKKNIKGKLTSEIIDLYYKKFNVLLTKGQIQAFKRKYKLTSGVNTKFKQGQKAHNWKPVGYEFVRDDGYVYIKIGEPNKWDFKHHYLYKKYKGEIPEGYSVVFLDQDKSNFDLDNLQLLERRNKLMMKNLHLFSSNKEITKTGMVVVELMNKINDINKINEGDGLNEAKNS